MGFVAGVVATTIGLTLGLISGYMGGFLDDLILFFTNLFTVIPSFVLLILISFSIGQEKRGALTIAVVIGLTSWGGRPLDARAGNFAPQPRSRQPVETLRHSSSHHPTDILPYIASTSSWRLSCKFRSAS